MGLTLSDRNKMLFHELASAGFSAEEILEQIPEYKREQFIKDIEMSVFKSHFGIEFKTFAIIMAISTLLILIIFFLL